MSNRNHKNSTVLYDQARLVCPSSNNESLVRPRILNPFDSNDDDNCQHKSYADNSGSYRTKQHLKKCHSFSFFLTVTLPLPRIPVTSTRLWAGIFSSEYAAR